jgi:hypothetical protein
MALHVAHLASFRCELDHEDCWLRFLVRLTVGR